ncbi:hypothetical protein FN846DRAFT_922079 [Sphaerosporella brunnea]|uniref:Uncharacterized protein n=1 Tax=Sphaerosporella brunnea TaxID=1250544 RepID=A0A5J5EKY6_9PEZI|nr:hypothetical protein FN846DRAFT_315437 [Sphaerosporella brunnea]KAA8895768.1 hypothetical protein FN846DRAFT_922079 [Sphaerosporella brunnea]
MTGDTLPDAPMNDAPMIDSPVNDNVSLNATTTQNPPPHPDHVRKWNYKELLEYLKPTLSRFSDSSRKAFEHQGIDGRTFLEEGCDSKFYREFMPAGPSMELAREAAFIENASVMKEHRILWDKIQRAPTDPATYADPANLLKLPFPNLFNKYPWKRFTLDDDGCFDYMGRRKFLEIYEEVVSMETPYRNKEFSLQGIVGYGKSHIMAALAILLMRRGKRVIYIPHCGIMATDLLENAISAFLLSYADDPHAQQRIAMFSSVEDVHNFCREEADVGNQLYILADQLNALDTKSDRITFAPFAEREAALAFLREIATDHFYVWSASGNFEMMQHDRRRDTAAGKWVMLTPGFTEDEMHHWWKHFEKRIPLALRKEDKEMLETYTGRAPILLRVLLDMDLGLGESANTTYEQQISKLFDLFFASSEVLGMIDNIMLFADEKFKLRDDQLLKRYKESSYACLTESAMPTGCPDDVIDNRYFYRTEAKGRATSLIAKKALANYLRHTLCTHTEFLSTRWYRSVQMAGDNSVLLGFLIEQMLLSWVSGNGCPSAGQEFNIPPTKTIPVQMFTGDYPEPTYDPLVLYVPTKFNFEAFDALLVHRDTANQIATIVPIRITLKEYHSDSEAGFFNHWATWSALFADDTVNAKFLWIKETLRAIDETTEVEAKHRASRLKPGNDDLVYPAYCRIFKTVADISPEIGAKLQNARQLRSIPDVASSRISLGKISES